MSAASREHRRGLVTAGLALALVPATFAVPALSATAAVRPAVIGRRVIGHSVQGRPIVAWHLGEPGRRKVVLIAVMHGDESAPRRVLTDLRDGPPDHDLNLWVVPVYNPDGLAAGTRKNAHRVDLNRNWPYRWAPLGGMYYSGPRAVSEPETRALLAFLRKLRPRYVVSMHQPLFGVDTTDGGAVDPAFRHRLARGLGLPSKPFRCWSICHGSLTGWYTAHHYGVAITVEFGAHPSRAYLTGRARRAIVAALGGRFGSPG
jgi:murein peptide amidase A